jgi:hypothetical protein
MSVPISARIRIAVHGFEDAGYSAKEFNLVYIRFCQA